MSQTLLQIAETSTNNTVRVTYQDERGKKIVTFAKVGDRHAPPVKFQGQISR